MSELERAHIQADTIEALPIPFCAVATDIQTGEEVAIRQGDAIKAVRANISVPGIFTTPVRSNGRILVNGGLTNPVPVSVVRAMGADFVIAVDLNHNIVAGKNLKTRRLNMSATPFLAETGVFSHWIDDYRQSPQELKTKLRAHEAPGVAQFSCWFSSRGPLSNIFEVLLASINIMKTRITQSRLDSDDWISSSSRRWGTSASSISAVPRRLSRSAMRACGGK